MKRPTARRAGMISCLVLIFIIDAAGQVDRQASQFLASLNDDLRSKAQFAFKDEERYNWNFVPVSRNGVPLRDLDERQRSLALDLLKATLSEQGYKKATGVVALESILRDVEGRSQGDSYRDSGKYFISVFGTPSATGLWGWRIEGHHLSFNMVCEDGKVMASTPSFLGANPAIVPRGDQRGHQLLKAETESGFALLNTLTPVQLATAIVSDRALPEIITGNQRKVSNIDPRGIAYRSMNADQQQAFMKLLDVFVLNYEFGFSSRLMQKIRAAGVDNLSFAWAGSRDPSKAHYYRIQGPMLLIEYDNTQNNANHVHTVVRDLTNDFAEDILKEHYEREHK